MLQKVKEEITEALKDPVSYGLRTAWYVVSLGVAIWTVLYALAFVKYLLTTAWGVLGF